MKNRLLLLAALMIASRASAMEMDVPYTDSMEPVYTYMEPVPTDTEPIPLPGMEEAANTLLDPLSAIEQAPMPHLAPIEVQVGVTVNLPELNTKPYAVTAQLIEIDGVAVDSEPSAILNQFVLENGETKLSQNLGTAHELGTYRLIPGQKHQFRIKIELINYFKFNVKYDQVFDAYVDQSGFITLDKVVEKGS